MYKFITIKFKFVCTNLFCFNDKYTHIICTVIKDDVLYVYVFKQLFLFISYLNFYSNYLL